MFHQTIGHIKNITILRSPWQSKITTKTTEARIVQSFKGLIRFCNHLTLHWRPPFTFTIHLLMVLTQLDRLQGIVANLQFTNKFVVVLLCLTGLLFKLTLSLLNQILIEGIPA